MSTISPELALVDPELAAAVRASLHEPGCFQPASQASAEPARTVALETRPSPSRRSRPRPSRVVLAGGVSAAIAVIALVAVSGLVGRRTTPVAADEAAVDAQARVDARQDAADSRRYEWPAVHGAVAYRAEIVRDGGVVFAATTKKPSIVLPKDLQLGPGSYVFLATPSSSGGVPLPDVAPVVEVKFVVSRAGGG